jgi:hypothetical protein
MAVKFTLLGLAFVVALCVAISINGAGEANHLTYLPGTPGTPLMQQIIKNQEYTYCLDNRASAYPNFRSQLEDVNREYTIRTGIRSREVPVNMDASLHLTSKFVIAKAAGCHVIHAMPDVHGCGGSCAAWIAYANLLGSVYIEYKYQLGYTDWRSTHGHELGHGLLGLHEGYNDSSGAISCTRRTDTVMDCGSGVRYPTVWPVGRDVEKGCAIILTSWCGTDGSAPPPPPCITPLEGVDGCNPDLYRFTSGWAYRFSDQVWVNPHGWPEWTACNQDKLRYNFHHKDWFAPGSSFYSDERGFFSSAGAC